LLISSSLLKIEKKKKKRNSEVIGEESDEWRCENKKRSGYENKKKMK